MKKQIQEFINKIFSKLGYLPKSEVYTQAFTQALILKNLSPEKEIPVIPTSKLEFKKIVEEQKITFAALQADVYGEPISDRIDRELFQKLIKRLEPFLQKEINVDPVYLTETRRFTLCVAKPEYQIKTNKYSPEEKSWLMQGMN